MPTETTKVNLAFPDGTIKANYSQHNVNDLNHESQTNPLTGAQSSAICRSNNNTEDIAKTNEARVHHSQDNTVLSKSSATEATLLARGGQSVMQHSSAQIHI
jgi:hypothetical protein